MVRQLLLVSVRLLFPRRLAVWFGIQSLLGGLRYAAYVRRETSRALPEFYPFVSVIAPTRGFEPGLPTT